MKTKYIVISLIAAALPIAGLIAEDTGNKQTTQKQEQNSSTTGKDQMVCKSFGRQDAELDQLVADMNSASPDKKLDAIAAVVAKLVEQRKATHEQMAKMMSADEKTGMHMCQMMMGMNMKGDEQKQNGGEHSHHHSD
jgi:formate dehydrogenase maturation protein FdhE